MSQKGQTSQKGLRGLMVNGYDSREGRGQSLGSIVQACALWGLGFLALACWLLLLPLADGVGVPHDDLIHPGERLWEENGAFEEAQVAAVQRQRKDHILFLFWRGEERKEQGKWGKLTNFIRLHESNNVK